MLERLKCKRYVYSISQSGAERKRVKSLFRAIWMLFGNVFMNNQQLSRNDSQSYSSRIDRIKWSNRFLFQRTETEEMLCMLQNVTFCEIYANFL